MKSETSLRRSYDLQKASYEEAKQRKISNIKRQQEAIIKKINDLQGQLDQLSVAQQKLQEQSFRTFQEFQNQASEASNKASQEKKLSS